MASHNLSGLKRDEKGRNIQVVVRCRPFNTMERKSSYGVMDCDPNRKEVNVKTGGMNDKASRKTYTFDMVFGPAAKQIEVYRSVVCPILDEVIMGYNCTVFAYGQTGTGKTFTMEGERSQDEEFTWEEDPLAGIIPRTLHQIFEKLSENGTEFSVKVSLLEIYNEELFDLLSPSEDVTERLQLFDDPRNKRGVVVKGLEEITVHNKDEVYQILERGSAKRRTASTLMNAYSSRSHSVFSVTIHMKEITMDGEELVKIGKLNLVDLAGSENIGRSGAVDKRAREAGNINQSLLTLGRVITALVEKRPHIPYRESKLTRILQDSLGGRTKTSIIATVSPSSSNLELLSTVDASTSDVTGLHDKLDRKKKVEQHNTEIQQSFSQRMEGALGNMQRCVQQQGAKHHNMLSSYSQAIDGVVVMNEAALKGALTTVESFVGGVGQLVAEGVTRCQDKVQQQEALCLQDKETLLQLLDEHRQDMEEVLVARTLMGLSAVKELNDTLRATVETQRALADKVEAMKEVGVFFNGLVGKLAGLREEAVQSLSSLQAENDKLEDEIRQAQDRHQAGMKQTMQFLQDQLNLLTMEAQKDYTDLRSATKALQKPLQVLQENISSGCSTVERQAAAQADVLSSTSSSLASSLRLNADESRQALEEMTGCCSHLHSSVSGLVQRDLEWSSRAREHAETQAQEHLSLMGKVSTEAQTLHQSVKMRCTEQLRTTEEELSSRQEEVKRSLMDVQNQTTLNRTALDQQQAELRDHVETSQQLVQGFLQEELQQDVPTGATPQRRDFVYPKRLQKLRSRGELLESLRSQQEELQAAIEKEEEEEEEEEDKNSQVDHDSLEDELSTCNESLATEPSFNDENLVFNESKRVPFFKQKKAGKKETKIPARQKVAENEASTPQKSRLPLRSQN
ncbi:kinesin-like protein KIF11 isoform X3 [Anoplopoma fimbria]|uniref:kinesin-like protein KIF11 isoform X3 n=1 Tax=Anoplopoma fimbria TaxID=229290 RepID=UPI0023EB3FC0|nr:kinesin-like protein KIF11 isoform X3 [Anoplopoma fimbria]